jgi:hypothetical protein
MTRMGLSTKLAVQSACVAVASRMVGASFRVAETYSETLQKSKVLGNPEAVLKREAVTVALAWVFALFTNILITPIAKRHKMGLNGVQFFTSVIGALAAEIIGRTLVYRKAVKQHLPASKPTLQMDVFQSSASTLVRRPIQPYMLAYRH